MANPTLLKFGFPETLLREFEHWVVLLRPAQVTLGSLVLAAKAEATSLSDLPDAAFTELAVAIRAIETALRELSDYEKINYLMLMMVDPNVHFHVFPRYSKPREWEGIAFPDEGWPGPPQLKLVVNLTPDQMKSLHNQIESRFLA